MPIDQRISIAHERLKHLIIFAIFATLALAEVVCADAKWLRAPQPKFPQDALKNGAEGPVTLRAVLEGDGHVKQVIIAKSSGQASLAKAAQRQVLKWRMDPRSIVPPDLTRGREVVIEFRQRLSALRLAAGCMHTRKNRKTFSFSHLFPTTLSRRGEGGWKERLGC